MINLVKEASFFVTISDSTPDISLMEQESKLLHNAMTEGDNVRTEELFLDFVEIKVKAAESTATTILFIQSDAVDKKTINK